MNFVASRYLALMYVIVYTLHFTIIQAFIPSLTNVYYFIIFVGLLFIIQNNKYHNYVMPLLLASAISLLFNSFLIPNSEMRWLLWITITLVFGPFISNSRIINFREVLLDHIIHIFVFITVGSFVWILLALPSYGVNEDLFLGEGKYFRNGLTTHEMTLAPIGGITGIFSIYKTYFHKKNNLKKLLFILLLLVSIGVMLMASSRTVILAFILTVVVISIINVKSLLKYYINNIFFINIVLILGFLSIAFNWSSLSNTIENNSRLSEKGIINSRQSLIDLRLEDFKESPVFGVGFCSVSKKVYNTGPLNNMSVKGEQIEFGSVYLQVASTMGLLGIASFLILIIKALRSGLRKSSNRCEQFYFSIFVFILFHSVAEAYVFSAGSIFCIFTWLILSRVCLNDRRDNIRILRSSSFYKLNTSRN